MTPPRNSRFKGVLSSFVGLLFLSVSAFATTPTALLTDILASTQTLQADFTQTVRDSNLKVLQEARGQFSLQHPGKFRWEIYKPNPQLIIANHGKIWLYDPDLEQVTIKKLATGAGDTPAMLLSSNNLNIAKDFSVQLQPSTMQIAGMKSFLLVPRDKDSMLERIKIQFLEQRLQAMQLEDHLGHSTMLQFQHVKRNIPLPAALFIFKQPLKTDVLDETKNH